MRRKNRKKEPSQPLLSNQLKQEKEFGGAHLKNSHAKKARPIAIKKTMHLTLRSSKAKGAFSFRSDKNRIQKIEKVVRTQAQKFGVEIFRYANVGNHLHLLVKASYRRGFICFLRSIQGSLQELF
jgi:REP element-mobilizing transposase RayT